MHGYTKTCFKPLLQSIFIGFEENIPFKGFLGVCMFFFFVEPSYLSYAWRQDTLLFVYLLYNHCSLLHGITNRQWIEKGGGSLDTTARTPDNKGTLSQVNAMFLNKVILISVLHSQLCNLNVLIILYNSYNYIKVEIKYVSLWFITIF